MIALPAQAAHRAALMDMWAVPMVCGHVEAAPDQQRQALTHRRTYRRAHGSDEALTVVALVTAGDFMANTPASARPAPRS